MMDPAGNTKYQQIAQQLLAWFFDNGRSLPWRESRTAYGTWVSETMLQQTRVTTVIPYYNRFLSLFPDIAALAAAPQEEVYKAWEGLGYYSRARNLQNGAKFCTIHFGGNLPADMKMLLSIPGIGPYTAGAIASLAFGLPEPAVDGNVIRVFSRLFALFIYPQDVKARKEIHRIVSSLLPEGNAGDFNEAIMDLGATICTPQNPDCKECPLSTLCDAFLFDKQKELPLRKRKKENPVVMYTVLVLMKGDSFFIRKRPDNGLLANLFEFPLFPGFLSKEEIEETIKRDFGFLSDQIISISPLGEAEHSFSHMKWLMEGYLIAVCNSGLCAKSGPGKSIEHYAEQQKIPTPLLFSEMQLQGDFYPIQAIKKMAFPSAIRAYTSVVFLKKDSTSDV